jgi:hypothetical protein
VFDERLHHEIERGVGADRVNHVALGVKNFTEGHGAPPYRLNACTDGKMCELPLAVESQQRQAYFGIDPFVKEF